MSQKSVHQRQHQYRMASHKGMPSAKVRYQSQKKHPCSRPVLYRRQHPRPGTRYCTIRWNITPQHHADYVHWQWVPKELKYAPSGHLKAVPAHGQPRIGLRAGKSTNMALVCRRENKMAVFDAVCGVHHKRKADCQNRRLTGKKRRACAKKSHYSNRQAGCKPTQSPQ